MADKHQVVTSSTGLRTGAGKLEAIVISCSNSSAATFTFYDNTAGSGTKILEGYVNYNHPMVLTFSERQALAFATGLYLTLAANLTATVWWREF